MVSAILIYLKLFHFLTRIILNLFVGESRLSICLYFKLVIEQELPTLPEYMSSPPVFSGVCVTRSLVLYVCFVDHCLLFKPLCCLLFFDIRFWLPLWYLQTLLKLKYTKIPVPYPSSISIQRLLVWLGYQSDKHVFVGRRLDHMASLVCTCKNFVPQSSLLLQTSGSMAGNGGSYDPLHANIPWLKQSP
jgi:hypothetical protein